MAALLDAEPVDAAWVCVAPAGHGALERSVIERGVPFFVDRAPRAAPADLDVASVSTAALRFASGALGTVTATCLLGASARVDLQLMREGELITVTQGSVTYDDALATHRLAHDVADAN